MNKNSAFELDPKGPRAYSKTNCIDLLRTTDRVTRWLKQSVFYKELKIRYPNLKKYTNGQIKGYVKRFNERLATITIEDRDGVMLPMKTGHLILATKNNVRSIDRRTSVELKKITHFTNEESYGYWMKIYYSPYGYNQFSNTPKPMFENSHLWSFASCRNYTDAASKAYRQDWKKYRVLGINRSIRNFYEESKYKPVKATHNNEFEF